LFQNQPGFGTSSFFLSGTDFNRGRRQPHGFIIASGYGPLPSNQKAHFIIFCQGKSDVFSDFSLAVPGPVTHLPPFGSVHQAPAFFRSLHTSRIVFTRSSSGV
jgi:hypothetical protein